MSGDVGKKQEGRAEKRKQPRLRWMLFLFLTPLSVFLCGQAAWMLRSPDEQVEIQSALTADYSPWTKAFFPGLDPMILLAALKDRNEGGLDTRRALNCFLVSSGCDPESQVDRLEPGEPGATAAPLRVANSVEPDLAYPDGQALAIDPGRHIVLDLSRMPVEVLGAPGGSDLVLFFLTEQGENLAAERLEIDLAMEEKGTWVPVFVRGDQIHGDIGSDLSYIIGSEAIGGYFGPIVSFEDAENQDMVAVLLAIDGSEIPTGHYDWLRIGIKSGGNSPMALDAVLVVD